MKKLDILTVIGVLGTVVGCAGSMISNYADEKKTDKIIEEKVAKAMAEQEVKES